MNVSVCLAALLVLFSTCTTSQPTTPLKVSPTSAFHTFAGGCAGTVLTDAEPPVWAQAGWTHIQGAPWEVPWALGTHNDIVAYVFASHLVAGSSPRPGNNNKVLWVSKESPSGAGVTVEGRPLGQLQPVVVIAGGPSIVNVPTPGCWTFLLKWGTSGQHTSTINFDVIPAG